MSDLDTAMISEYGELADEYYDPTRHPTCANFRKLSYLLIEKILSASPELFNKCLEIGAGRSVMAELRKNGLERLGHLTISDKSERMLRHSSDLAPYYDADLLLDIEDTPNIRRVCTGQYDLVVASLSDPYNGEALLQSLKKIIDFEGRVILTTPSHEWANAYRKKSQSGLYNVAVFISKDGTRHYLRSIILPIDEQIELCDRFDFRISCLEQIYCDQIPAVELSTKLAIVRRNRLPAVTGYVLTRQ